MEIVDKLNQIIGREMKYKQLCECIGVEPKTGNSKKAQMNSLSMYCNIEVLEKPTRYMVTKVYEDEVELLGLLSTNNKYQIMFEAAVYQAFVDNNGQPLYLSNMDTLKLFQEVNENFAYACNKDFINSIDEQYHYMPEMGLALYRILNQWTKRRLKSMENRHSIKTRECYRLYKKINVGAYEYIESINVPTDSELERRCQEIYNDAIDEVMPPNWGNVDKGGKFWVPDHLWAKFQSKVRELVKDKFNGAYFDLKPIMKISCPTEGWLKGKIASLCKELNALTAINEESCRKALETKNKQMDNITQGQRKQFIEINMKPNPSISFKQIMKRLDD